MLELELVLVPFAQKHFDSLSENDRETYIRLLEEDDWRIHDWLHGRSHPRDLALGRMVALIQRVFDAPGRCE